MSKPMIDEGKFEKMAGEVASYMVASVSDCAVQYEDEGILFSDRLKKQILRKALGLAIQQIEEGVLYA